MYASVRLEAKVLVFGLCDSTFLALELARVLLFVAQGCTQHVARTPSIPIDWPRCGHPSFEFTTEERTRWRRRVRLELTYGPGPYATLLLAL